MMGQYLSPILESLEEVILDFEERELGQPKFPEEAVRAATKIFSAVVMDKMWDIQEKENMDMEDRCNMVDKAGKELQKYIKTYCDIDTFEMFNF